MLKRPCLLLCIVSIASQMAFANFTDTTTTALTAQPTTTPAPDPEITLSSTAVACNPQLSGKSVSLGNAVVYGIGPQLTCTLTLNIKNGQSLKSLVLTHNGSAGAARTTYYSCSSSTSGGQNCGYKLGFRHARAWFKATYSGCGLDYPVSQFITAPDVFHGYAQTPYSFPVYLATNCADNDSITIHLQHYIDEGDTGWGQPHYNGVAGFVQELDIRIAPNAPRPASSSASGLAPHLTWFLLATMALVVL